MSEELNESDNATEETIKESSEGTEQDSQNEAKRLEELEQEIDGKDEEIRNKTFRLEIAYEGLNYRGWQRQRDDQEQLKSSVAEQVEQAARKAMNVEKVSMHGSGRTDSGVHARGQVAHLRASTRLSAEILFRAMNSFLPKDIRVLLCEEVAHTFHAQKDAESKQYRYFVLQNPKGVSKTSWPFLHGWAWYVPQELNIDAMERALDLFRGEKDFAAFQNVGTEQADTIREMYSAELIIHEHPFGTEFPWMPPAHTGLRLIEFSLHGSGFLKQMVRNIVGTVVEVGKGRFTVSEVVEILETKDRRNAGITAPAYGLFMEKVVY